jgi:hypothetical protein
MQGGIDMSGNAIENLPTPALDGDAANKQYVDDTVAGAVPVLTGFLKRDGTNAMTANLNVGTNKVVGVVAGTATTDAVNLSQLNAVETGALKRDGTNSPSANIPWNGKKITDLADGDAPQDAATVSQIPILTNYLKRDGSNSPSANIDWNGKKLTGLADGEDPQDAATVAQLGSGKVYGEILNGSVTGDLSGLSSSSMVIGAGPVDAGTWPALTVSADGRLLITGCGRGYPNDTNAAVNVYIRRIRDSVLTVVGAANYVSGATSVSVTRSVDALAGDQYAFTYQTNISGVTSTDHCMNITG